MAYAPTSRHLLRAKDLADARYFEPLGVSDMARAAGLSRAHFSREFRRAFGDPPHTYLLTRRLERAAALLRNTDRSVTDICLSVGLRSLASFTTSFTRAYGMSPTAYRAGLVRAARIRSPAIQHISINRIELPRLASRGDKINHSKARLTMIKLSTTQLWVHDQDEALDFWTNKVGMELRTDVTLPEMGNFRWLTVGPADQPDIAIVLMAIPGPPVMDEATAGQVRDLMSKGFAGTVFLTTDDVQSAHEELTGRGVEFTEEPQERPYGIDAGFRDPSGNSIRITQVRENVGL
jgi:AraC-like DNA-binding protein/catechol 2,3-dioxygenase-like lactoylglutathione lyase family enzyme